MKLCREVGIKPVLGVDIRNGDAHCYLLIARNNAGLFWINTFLSKHLIEKKGFSSSVVAPSDVFVVYPYGVKQTAELLANERIGVKPYQVGSLLNFDAGDCYVIHQQVVVQGKDHYYLHCLLRAIDYNLLLSVLQSSQVCQRVDVFVSPTKILTQCRLHHTQVTNTYKLLDACSIHMDFEKDKTRFVRSVVKKNTRR